MTVADTIRPKGLLNLPTLVEPGERLDMHPKSINAWLKQLPRANTGECAKQINDILFRINHFEIPVNARHTLMTELSVAVAEISNTIAQHYANKPLPLSPKNRQIAELAIVLNYEMAISSQILVEHYWSDSLNLFNRKKVSQAIHQAIYYLSQVLLTCFEIYRDTPPNSWINIHQMYAYAELNSLHQQSNTLHQSQQNFPTTIEEAYKCIVLFGLLGPYRIRQPLIEKIFNALLNWSQFSSILPSEGYSEDSDQVLIKLNSDATPGFHFADKIINHEHARVLDNARLVKQLRENIKQLEAGGHEEDIVTQLPLPILKLLVTTWNGKSRRLYNRTRIDSTLDVLIGVNNVSMYIHELRRKNKNLLTEGPESRLFVDLIQGKPEDFDEILDAAEPIIDSTAKFNVPQVYGLQALDTFQADIWDNDYASKSIGYEYNVKEITKKHKDESPPPTPSYSFNHVNESTGGYGLLGYMVYKPEVPKIQIGELIGIHRPHEQSVALGIIRRLKEGERGLEIGVQKLSPYADAVATCLFRLRAEKIYHHGLILPVDEQQQRPLTLISHTPYKVGDELLVNKNGYRALIRLTKGVVESNAYYQYEFELIKTLGIEQESADSADISSQNLGEVWTLI